MLQWLAMVVDGSFGPIRLFGSFFFMAGTGFAVTALATWVLMPRLWGLLPKDQGRAHAVNAEQSIGKPLSTGVIFVGVFAVAALLFLPFDSIALRTVPLILAAMLVGYFDDRRAGGFKDYQLAVMDGVLALAAAVIVCGLEPSTIWLPVWRDPIVLPAWLMIPLAAGVIWVAINATNCSDGVDGVSGSLTGAAIIILGGLLYAVIGDAVNAGHLYIPTNPQGASWALMAFLMVGAVAGYLWYNAAPSLALMGDAGSRPLGLLIGLLVVASGNPFFLLMVGLVIVLNGATGWIKVLLIRLFRIHVLKSVRFPLHDHARKELGWSNTQVLVRFMLLHLGVSALLVTFVLKVR